MTMQITVHVHGQTADFIKCGEILRERVLIKFFGKIIMALFNKLIHTSTCVDVIT